MELYNTSLDKITFHVSNLNDTEYQNINAYVQSLCVEELFEPRKPSPNEYKGKKGTVYQGYWLKVGTDKPYKPSIVLNFNPSYSDFESAVELISSIASKLDQTAKRILFAGVDLATDILVETTGLSICKRNARTTERTDSYTTVYFGSKLSQARTTLKCYDKDLESRGKSVSDYCQYLRNYPSTLYRVEIRQKRQIALGKFLDGGVSELLSKVVFRLLPERWSGRGASPLLRL